MFISRLLNWSINSQKAGIGSYIYLNLPFAHYLPSEGPCPHEVQSMLFACLFVVIPALRFNFQTLTSRKLILLLSGGISVLLNESSWLDFLTTQNNNVCIFLGRVCSGGLYLDLNFSSLQQLSMKSSIQSVSHPPSTPCTLILHHIVPATVQAQQSRMLTLKNT